VVALVLLAVILPQITLAAENSDTNETQINNKINNSINLEKELIVSHVSIAKKITEDHEGYESAKIIEEKRRETVLARFKHKLEKANFPPGKFVLNASAYTAAADECGKSDGITASGVKVKENRTLACPPSFPFGTKIQIDGMGIYVCEDRGGAIKGNHVDIYMETKAQAFAFGRRNLTAEVVLN
jgi:3D (Asp-Asp-Asp) domain-containing protein